MFCFVKVTFKSRLLIVTFKRNFSEWKEPYKPIAHY